MTRPASRYLQGFNSLYQQKRVRFYAQIIATLATTIFFLIFAIKPTVTTITQLIKEIDDKKIVAARLEQKIQALITAQKTYISLETFLPLINEALPSDPQLASYLRQLEALSRQTSLLLTTLQTNRLVLKDQPSTNQDHFTLTLTLKGSYSNLHLFLSDLYRLRRLLEITNFNFKTDSQAPDSLNLTLTTKVYIFDQAHVSY
jgi:Tfp pilus assembly protein PilO